METGRWKRVQQFSTQCTFVALNLVLVFGLVVFTGGWFSGMSNRPVDEPQAVHVLALIFGTLAALLGFYTAFTLEKELSQNLLYASMLFLMATYAIFGSTLGVNSYYIQYCGDEMDTYNTTNCEDTPVKVQYAGAAIASVIVFIQILVAQQQSRALRLASEGRMRMSEVDS
ncbi:hypothetical protein DIPPA_04487 [Diplonema papillatum]|nr:hypothetical protein DIPPA_04487 [Diplonema papillatum]|eukprot:gene23186-35531_t